jgi:hypothetical protein
MKFIRSLYRWNPLLRPEPEDENFDEEFEEE